MRLSLPVAAAPVPAACIPAALALVLAATGCSSTMSSSSSPPSPSSQAPSSQPPKAASAPRSPRVTEQGSGPDARGSNRYPAAPRGTVTDTFHGVMVPDPYRWLEDMDSPETRAWIDAENELANAELGALPGRDKLRARIAELVSYDRYRLPIRRGKRMFWFHHDGGPGQEGVEGSSSPEAAPALLLDGNEISKDGSLALRGIVPSHGKLLAYGVSKGGGDWHTWRLRDIDTRQDLADELPDIKYYEPVFAPDGKGLYYSRFPAPASGTELLATDRDCKVYFHRVGTRPDQDVVVYERPDQPTWQFEIEGTPDDRYLVISIGDGQVGDSGKEQIAYLDLGKRNAKVMPLIDEFDAEYVFAGNDGPVFYFKTNLDAPRKRVIAIDVRSPAREHWKTVVSEAGEAIASVSLAGRQLFVSRLTDAHTTVTAYDLQGKKLRDVPLPGLGNAFGFRGTPTDKDVYYYFTDFTVPGLVLRYELATGKSTPWRTPKVAFDPTAFETTQVFFPSKDGTKVPMFITAKKGLTLDGARPTIMTAYGFGGISSLPFFDPVMIAWLERGGVFVLVNIRGGGEYGEEWHRASMRATRQTGIDDFIAAGAWLVANKYTSPKNLGVTGASGGGLLVGSATVQRPDLYGASVPRTGVHDLLRFHRFGQGAGWRADLGSVEIAEEFAALRKTSPLHNVKPGTRYPPMLIVTGDHDVRVAPLHSYKFAAALQHAQAGEAPIVLRIETRSGHGGGATQAQRIEQRTDMLAFFAKHLGLSP